MPHIVVEHTDTLSINMPELLHDLHESLAGQDTVAKAAIKTRAIPVQHCIVGTDELPENMIHVTLRLLPGRDDGLKKTMAQGLFDVIRTRGSADDLSISVEVVDLHDASYTK